VFVGLVFLEIVVDLFELLFGDLLFRLRHVLLLAPVEFVAAAAVDHRIEHLEL